MVSSGASFHRLVPFLQSLRATQNSPSRSPDANPVRITVEMGSNPEHRRHHRLSNNNPKSLLLLFSQAVIPPLDAFPFLFLVADQIREGTEELCHPVSTPSLNSMSANSCAALALSIHHLLYAFHSHRPVPFQIRSEWARARLSLLRTLFRREQFRH